MRKKSENVRIIGGGLKRRKVSFLSRSQVRPSSDRVRETLFNWLMPVIGGSQVVDLFAGSGVLAFEAISRGAAHAIAIENNLEIVRKIEEQANLLGIRNFNATCLDAYHWTEREQNIVASIVFCDPPFEHYGSQPGTADNKVTKLLYDLAHSSRVSNGAYVYLESPVIAACEIPNGFYVHRQMKAGRVRSLLLVKNKVNH